MLAQKEEETAPSSALSAEVVGNAFVKQYYRIVLHKSPELLHQFYKDSSFLSRPDTNGVMTTVTTMQAINEKILSLNYEDYTTEIETADAQESYEKGLIVLVTGCLTGKNNVKKKFTQTFFLAPQEKGYFVLNDVFRFVGVIEPTSNTSALANGISENAPATALTAESGWDEVVEPGRHPYIVPPPIPTEENITGAALSGRGTRISNQYSYSLSSNTEENITGATPSGTVRHFPYNIREAALLPPATEENITGAALSGRGTRISNHYSYSLSPATEENITGATPSYAKHLPYNIRGATPIVYANRVRNQVENPPPLVSNPYIRPSPILNRSGPLPRATEEDITGAALSGLETGISNHYSYSLSPATEENITGATPSYAKHLPYNIRGATPIVYANRVRNQVEKPPPLVSNPYSRPPSPIPNRSGPLPRATEEDITGAALSGLETGISNQYSDALPPVTEENITAGENPSIIVKPLPYN